MNRKYLDLVIEATNVLTLATNKGVFSSLETIRDTFPALNMTQISRLLDNYAPDSFAPEEVPKEVKQSVATINRQLAQKSETQAPLFLPASLSI